jgi:hypothetical protein
MPLLKKDEWRTPMLENISWERVKEKSGRFFRSAVDFAKSAVSWAWSFTAAIGEHVAMGFAFAFGFFTLFKVFPTIWAWLATLSLSGIATAAEAFLTTAFAVVVTVLMTVGLALLFIIKIVLVILAIVAGVVLLTMVADHLLNKPNTSAVRLI